MQSAVSYVIKGQAPSFSTNLIDFLFALWNLNQIVFPAYIISYNGLNYVKSWTSADQWLGALGPLQFTLDQGTLHNTGKMGWFGQM